ncbi:ATP-binding protein [Natrialbaceae archaeon GCM10025810]|uniref:ATP-binding protein n=1 Tax=Halovalidus salilacus TaxID=3075124 RepID=UPI003615FB2E
MSDDEHHDYDYWTEFVQDSRADITALNNALLALERTPEDAELMDEIFRIAHTLKGNAGSVGLAEASDLAHAIEDLLDAVRSGTLPVTPEVMDVVFDAVDELEGMVEDVARDGEIRTDPSATIDRLRGKIAEARNAPPISPPTDEEIDAVLERFDPPADERHDAYFVRLSINESDLEEVLEGGASESTDGHLVVEALIDAFDLVGCTPSKRKIRDGDYDGRFDAVFATAVGETAIAAALEPVEAVADFEIVDVTERFGAVAATGDSGSEIDLGADDPKADLSPHDAQELSVDELLDEFDEFDDLDEMVEEVENDDDLEAFDRMGDAGSFDDLFEEAGVDFADDADDGAASNAGPGAEAAAESADSSAEDATDADDAGDDVEDASAVFEELKEEVEMVGFDELQEELEELEFDEFDADDEVGMDELLGDEFDADDEAFLDVDADPEAGIEIGAGGESGTDAVPADDVTADDDESTSGDAEGERGDEEPLEPTAATDAADEPLESEPDERSIADDSSPEDVDEAGDDVDDVEHFSFTDAEAEPDAASEASADDDPVGAAGNAADDTDVLAALEDADVGDTEAGDPWEVDRSAESDADGSDAPDEDAVGDDVVETTSEAEPVEDEVRTPAPDESGSNLEAEPHLEAESKPDSAAALETEASDESADTEVEDPDDLTDDGAEDADSPFDDGTEDTDSKVASPEGEDDEAATSIATDDGEFDATDVDDSFAPAADADGFDDDVEFDDSFDAGATDFDAAAAFEDDTEFDDEEFNAADYDDEEFDATEYDDGFGDDEFADDGFEDESVDGPDDEFEADADDGLEDAVFDAVDAAFDASPDVADVDAAGGDAADGDRDADAADSFGDDSVLDREDDGDDDVVRIVDEPDLEIPDVTVPETRDRATTDDGVEGRQSVRVDVEQVDSLLRLVEGLVTTRVRLRHAAEELGVAETLDRELDDLEELTTGLQETVMDVRLVPLETVANRLPRVVRDIAREQDKEVEFELTGEGVELDRGILDRIRDPLIHLVRNAVDHGIEPPAEREAADKPREGTVEVHADRERDRVTITVEDDGSGIDPDDLRDAAVDADLLSREDADALHDEETYDLIFHPGLSTAEEVTDVSGRGVGMDVVERTIEELDGTLHVESEPGEGTTMTMELPVTVAIAEVLFVECGGEEFGVPLKAVQDIDSLDALETVDGEEVLVVDGAEYPVLSLDDALETPRAGVRADGDDEEAGMIVRIRDDVRPIALRCDYVSGQQEVVVKPFEGFMGGIPGLSGATVRGRGEVVNILDVSTL